MKDKTYTFAELSPTAKDKARENWRDQVLCDDWWAPTYEDAANVGKLMGIEIGEKANRTIGGGRVASPDIWFRGFYSQGDGAGWSGWVDTALLAGCVARVKAEAPKDTELHLVADLGERVHALLAAHHMMWTLDNDNTIDYFDMRPGMWLHVNGNGRGYSTCFSGIEEITMEVEKVFNEFVSDFADWIYDQLEAENSYLTDDAQLIAAGLEFDEDGEEA